MKSYRWTWGVISKIPFSDHHFFLLIGTPFKNQTSWLIKCLKRHMVGMGSIYLRSGLMSCFIGLGLLERVHFFNITLGVGVMPLLNLNHWRKRSFGAIKLVSW